MSEQAPKEVMQPASGCWAAYKPEQPGPCRPRRASGGRSNPEGSRFGFLMVSTMIAKSDPGVSLVCHTSKELKLPNQHDR